MLRNEEVIIKKGREKGIHATVLDTIDNVVMVLPWNSGKETIFKRDDLSRTGRMASDPFK
jgi:hypothetical protein